MMNSALGSELFFSLRFHLIEQKEIFMKLFLGYSSEAATVLTLLYTYFSHVFFCISILTIPL